MSTLYDEQQIATERTNAPAILRQLAYTIRLADTAVAELQRGGRLVPAGEEDVAARFAATVYADAYQANEDASAEAKRETWDSATVDRYVAALARACRALKLYAALLSPEHETAPSLDIDSFAVSDDKLRIDDNPRIGETWSPQTFVGERVDLGAPEGQQRSRVYLTEAGVREITAASIFFFVERTSQLSPALRLQLAQKEHVRVPVTPVVAITAARTGKDVVEHGRDLRGETFAAPGLVPGLHQWKFRVGAGKAQQLALSVPVAEGMDDPFAAARHGFTGTDLRTWVAMFSLPSVDSRAGVFRVDEREFLLDVLGLKPEWTTSKGKRYPRPPRKAERELKETKAKLESTLFYGIGPKEWNPPQPLVSRYEVTDTPTGDAEDLYVHAPFAWEQVWFNFMQFPRAALLLDARDTAVAVGVAALLRSQVGRGAQWVDTGKVQLTLADLARAVGLQSLTERAGGWAEAREKIARVVAQGGFGQLHVGRGDYGEQQVTLAPSASLATVYEPLRRKQLQPDPGPALDAIVAEEVKRALRPKRPPGRPRKRR